MADGAKYISGKFTLELLELNGKGRENVFFLFMVLHNLYLSRCFREQDLAPFPTLCRLGCQRVVEPVLSPLLYKSKPFEGY